MYWVKGNWHMLRHEQTYTDGTVQYFVLIKTSPFKNRHPALEPDLIGTCIASTMEEAEGLALSFITMVDEHGIVPVSPYTASGAASA